MAEQKDCAWWVDDNEEDIGNYTHENAVNHDSGFCLMKDFFEKCDGKCEDYHGYKEVKLSDLEKLNK